MAAEWARDSRHARSVEDLILALGGPLPPDLESALLELRGFSLDDVLPEGDRYTDSSTMIGEFLTGLGSDGRFVIARHIASPEGSHPTLDSLGESVGLTRERVRQLVKRGLATAEELRAQDQFRLLNWRAADLRSSLGALCPADAPAFEAAIARATSGFVEPDVCTAAEFLLWLSGQYRLDGDWWISARSGGLEAVKRSLRSALEGEWLLTRAELLNRLPSGGIGGSPDEESVTTLSGWRHVGDDAWVRWDGAIGDKAERVLRLVSRAVSVPEMNELIGEGHALSSVQNALSGDSRFMRVSMELDYALSDWGWEEYSTAAQEIRERIERAGGEARLDDVVIELFDQFGLKEATVRAYAASPAFVVTNGTIRLRREDEDVAVNDKISAVEGLYVRGDDRVVFHLLVDEDVLRGSGRSIPNPLSAALGVRPDGARDFSAGQPGRIRISWPATAVTGAAIGSTRLVAERLEAKAGETLRLVFNLETESVDCTIASGSSLSDLTGLVLTPGKESVELAAAIRVDPLVVRAALAERGDLAVASMIPDPSSSSELDDALMRLDDLLS